MHVDVCAVHPCTYFLFKFCCTFDGASIPKLVATVLESKMCTCGRQRGIGRQHRMPRGLDRARAARPGPGCGWSIYYTLQSTRMLQVRYGCGRCSRSVSLRTPVYVPHRRSLIQCARAQQQMPRRVEQSARQRWDVRLYSWLLVIYCDRKVLLVD